MTDAAVISGEFCTFRHVQGRKVLQIVIEVPAEAAGAVFARLGMPGSGEGIPVAVARLQTPSEPTHTTPEPGEITSKTGAVTRRFSELPYSQQAALRCGEPDFAKFLAYSKTREWRAAAEIVGPHGVWAPEAVRSICGIGSRSEIIKGTPAGDKWAALEAEFYAWQRGMR